MSLLAYDIFFVIFRLLLTPSICSLSSRSILFYDSVESEDNDIKKIFDPKNQVARQPGAPENGEMAEK